MRNTWIICRKEMRSYFTSPVAYLLLTMFAFIFGWFFWNVLGYVIANTNAAMSAASRSRRTSTKKSSARCSPTSASSASSSFR